jgi:hypothetical protein
MIGSICTPPETAIRGSIRKELTDNISRMPSDEYNDVQQRPMDYVFGSDRMTRFYKDCTQLNADEGGKDVTKTDGNE